MCWRCNWRRWVEGTGGSICINSESRAIPSPSTIPEWCPLPDAGAPEITDTLCVVGRGCDDEDPGLAQERAVAAFIAAARTAVPALLADVAELEAEVARLTGHLAHVMSVAAEIVGEEETHKRMQGI